MESKFVPGRLVCSTAGRDEGTFYLVYNILSDTMVQVVDGERRKVIAPKRKNIKHLKPYPHLSVKIMSKSSTGRKITDLDVRNELQILLAKILNKGGELCQNKT